MSLNDCPSSSARSISRRLLCPQTLHVIGTTLCSPQPAQPERNRNTLKAHNLTWADSGVDESEPPAIAVESDWNFHWTRCLSHRPPPGQEHPVNSVPPRVVAECAGPWHSSPAPKIPHAYLALKLRWDLERTKCAQWCTRRQRTRGDVRVLRFPGNQQLNRAESPRGASISALKSFSRQRECGFESRPGHSGGIRARRAVPG
jgi:hypothetical protein